MADEQVKPGLWVWVKRAVMILVLIGSVTATATSALKYFAHAEDLRKTNTQQELSERRLALSISQDNVRWEDSNVRWMKQQAVFERKANPLSPAEQEMIEAAEKDLAQQKAQHNERIQRFEENYKQEF